MIFDVLSLRSYIILTNMYVSATRGILMNVCCVLPLTSRLLLSGSLDATTQIPGTCICFCSLHTIEHYSFPANSYVS